MEKFTVLTGIAAPLPMTNVDTDMIIPKQFLRTIKRTGLGKNLFNDMRYEDNGAERSDFVLNKEPYRAAKILVAGDNFGCGSSREHAPWALLDFGIRCVIAPDFADIFFNNSFKNGILLIRLDKETVADITKTIENAATAEMTVDLEACTVTYGGKTLDFTVDEFRRECLLKGLDDIGLTLENAQDIETYEQMLAKDRPWIAA